MENFQNELLSGIKNFYPDAIVKKINKDNFLDIHLPQVNENKGTHLFFNTSKGKIKIGFYCRDDEFNEQVLSKSENLEKYAQGIRLKENPEFSDTELAIEKAVEFINSILKGATISGANSKQKDAKFSKFFERIKAAYGRCSIAEEKNYASFTFKAAFLYELRVQKDIIRLLAANYPKNASIERSLEIIAKHEISLKLINNQFEIFVEEGKVSPDKLTVRIEIPYKLEDMESDSFIDKVIACCEEFHSTLMPLINEFQPEPVGSLKEIMGDGTPTPTSGTGPKKEDATATSAKEEELSMFDLTEFDEEGRPIGMKGTHQAPPEKELERPELDLNSFLSTFGMDDDSTPKTSAKAEEKPKEPAQFDESDRCLNDPMPFLTCIQLMRFYYSVLSSDSKAYRASYEDTLQEFIKAAVVPRMTNKMARLSHEGGNLGLLLRGPMQKSWEIYDKDYPTHDDYVRSLTEHMEELLPFCNEGLFLDTLELFMYLGDMLEVKDSPTGSLAPQDRYFPLFLMLKASPEQDIDNLEMVLNKGGKSRNAKIGVEVNRLLLKASGNFNQLSNEEKLALVLYDFILWDENPGLDIKRADIAAAKSIFALVTQNASLGEKLVGGFNDNASFEIFQFFNVEFNRKGFHQFCLERWKELSSEWNVLKLQLLIEGVRRDFHPNTYINNPVLEDYLNIFTGVKTVDLTGTLATVKEEEDDEELKIEDYPYSIDEVNKTVEMSVFHQILFLILYVGGKTENHTDEEIADVTSTAVTIGVWFDKDEDEGWEVLEETFEVLQKCGKLFTTEEILKIADECCFSIHDGITNADAQKDIIRFITDQAKADGELDLWEETFIDSWSLNITIGRGWGN